MHKLTEGFFDWYDNSRSKQIIMPFGSRRHKGPKNHLTESGVIECDSYSRLEAIAISCN